ncbi:ArsR/SmtB family transcription factor [Luedemannella flava]
MVHAAGWRPVLQYPATEAGTRPVPLDMVRRRIDALAHPVRQRLARTLARGPHTTGELAEAWQLTAPEVSRHLAVLKKAGLVSTTRRGRYVLYQLDLAASARLGDDFVEALLR